MRFIDLAKTRRSVRSYTDDPVTEEVIVQCLEAARLAPSATNSQPWRFIVVDEQKKLQEVAHATFNPVMKFNQFTLKAKALVVLVMSKGNAASKFGQRMTGLPYYLIDAGIVAEHFCLQAAELGLGTCMVGWFNEKKLKKSLDIRSSERVGLVIALGYPKAQNIPEKKRKPMDQIYTRNR